MRYYIKTSIILILSLLFTSCGDNGGSNSSNSNSTTKLTITTKQSTLDVKKNSLKLNFIINNNYNSELLVKLEDISIDIDSCSEKEISIEPKDVNFSKNNKEAYVRATVEFEGECNPSYYTVSGSKTLILGGKSNQISYKSQDISISTEGKDNNFSKSEAYYFFNIPKPINIASPNKEYSFKLQLINDESQNISGQEIKILTYDTDYGEIKNLIATTDENGFATFIFKSPEDISKLIGKSLTLTAIQGEGIFETSVDIKFYFLEKTTTFSNYHFINATDVVVTQSSQNREVSIDLVDNNGVGIEGKKVEITTIPKEFGSLSNSFATTNEAGRAIFGYISPENIHQIDGGFTTATVTLINEDVNISKKIKIKIREEIVFVDSNISIKIIKRYHFQNSSSISIQEPNQTKEISIDLVDKNNIGVPNETVYISNIPKEFGTLHSSSATTNEAGRANFIYTSPENISNMGEKSIPVTISFIHEDERRVSESTNINIHQSTDYIYQNYGLKVTTIDNNDLTVIDNNFSMSIPNLQKEFKIHIYDKKNNNLKDKDKDKDINITKIYIETQNSLIAKIYNPLDNSLTNGLVLKNENNASFIIKSKKLSGIVPLKATIKFLDINKEEKELSSIVNVRVMSGPPSAISVSYVSTTQDEARAKYIENFAISVTDEYGNKVNTRPYISLGAIVGYTVDGQESSGVETNETKRLFYGRADIASSRANGIINALDDDLVNTTNFEDTTNSRNDVFKYVNAKGANTDKLVVFGAGKNYEAMGKWDFHKIDNNTLSIQDDYFGEYRSGLYYAVGHNYYQDQCQDDGREWIGSTDSESYQLDEQGTVSISYKYDYHLTGKDALIWVNLNGYQADTKKDTRIGEVVKHTLRGRGLRHIPEGGYSLDKGESGYAHFVIWHENAPERYRNANFSHTILAESTCNAILVAHSNWNDARTCQNGKTINGNYYGSYDGGSFLTYEIHAPSDKACNFNLTRLLTMSEFDNINGKE